MKKYFKLICVLCFAYGAAHADDKPTQFTNIDGIKNTRHNMMQSTITNGGAMNTVRNYYGEICVYCHTPHGANIAAGAPLWNRSLPTSTTYVTYDKLNTSSLTQTVSQPGAASLPCLSCHDGSQAIDAIMNMPGSGQYSATPNPALWNPAALGLPAAYKAVQHHTLIDCMACHTDPTGMEFATDFTAFVIGTDLKNDHPVGVNYPTTTGAGTDWKTPDGSITRGTVVTTFFDDNTNGRMDKGDVRLYGSGTDSRVECASCHDPHGVPSGGAGTTINPTFLRKTNAGSLVCLTCHTK